MVATQLGDAVQTGLAGKVRMMAIGRKTALPRNHARPPEIGAAAVYLASDQAAFVTGHILQVDGGVCLV
jgi:enoyl-[acyl-carrier-protein] reductase (NADH)